MLDMKWIRDNPDRLDEALAKRGADPVAQELIALDDKRRTHVQGLQDLQARRNAASKEIGKAKASGDEAAAQKVIDEIAALKSAIQAGEDEERRLDAALADALAVVPNMPLDDVPVGADETANREERRVGEKPSLNDAKEHFEIGEALGQMDFETAAKLSGSRFVVLKGQLARLERALGQFMIDLHTNEHGYTEVQPPLLVRDEVLFGTGQLPKFAEDQFKTLRKPEDSEMGQVFTQSLEYLSGLLDVKDDDLWIDEGNVQILKDEYGQLWKSVWNEFEKFSVHSWLIPTAEVPLTNLVREQIVEAGELPMRVTALTPCFRSEAGSAGKDTRGMLRQHQFNKVELVSITTPEKSIEEHERMTACAEEVLKRLGLHYRVMTLSTGDMGFGARKTYDIEAWLPGQGAYREISSCSVCGDFQARRMNARYRPEGEKATRFVHTLNGSGVATGRALIAVMENYQNEDGSITVPDVLQPYMAGESRIG
jgi:seryl-tRNA synthetase